MWGQVEHCRGRCPSVPRILSSVTSASIHHGALSFLCSNGRELRPVSHRCHCWRSSSQVGRQRPRALAAIRDGGAWRPLLGTHRGVSLGEAWALRLGFRKAWLTPASLGKPRGVLSFSLKLLAAPGEGGKLGQCRSPRRSAGSNTPQTHGSTSGPLEGMQGGEGSR